MQNKQVNNYALAGKLIHAAGVRYLNLIIILLISTRLNAQDGNILKIDSQLNISHLLGEISGMSFLDNYIYAINDGGNGSYVFKLDIETGEIITSYRIKSISNIDWEEIAIYNRYLYIGDLGNNSGARKNLAIHRIKIDSLNEFKPPVLNTGIEYLLQKDFTRSMHNHEWDCEALIVNEDGIFCFSKNWKNRTTKVYHVREGRKNVLSPVDSINPGFLVTGAYYHSYEKSLYLCGYYKNETHLLHCKNVEYMNFFEDCTAYIIPELGFTQVESLFVRGNYIYLASERTLKGQAIYRIHKSGLK